jgi:hypothetical protein
MDSLDGRLMARIRSVHPDICTDEVMATLTAECERMFVRLWTHLDDEGRCVDNPMLLKAALFPLMEGVSQVDVDCWVDGLVAAGVVRRYEVDGRRYLSAKPQSWTRWQKPRRKVESKLPAVPPCADIVGTVSDIVGACPPVVGGGGGDVGGGGDGEETEKEGESEGEVAPAVARPQAVDGTHGAPLRERLARIEANPPTGPGPQLRSVPS